MIFKANLPYGQSNYMVKPGTTKKWLTSETKSVKFSWPPPPFSCKAAAYLLGLWPLWSWTEP